MTSPASLKYPARRTPLVGIAPEIDAGPPEWSWLAMVGAGAVALRVLLALLAIAVYHRSLFDIAQARDGPSYIHMAQALIGDSRLLTDFDRRVFVGYPALIAPFAAIGIPAYVAALLESWLSAGLATMLAGRLFRSRRLALAMAVLLPSSLVTTTLVYNEGPLLVLMLAGLLAAQRQRRAAGGLLLGMAGAVRPVACFAVLGAMAVEARRRRWREGLTIGAVAAATLAVELLAFRAWSGDALQGLKVYANNPSAYGGHMFALPFQTLVATPFLGPTPLWKVGYVWGLAVIVLIGNAIAWRRAVSGPPTDGDIERDLEPDLDLMSFVWLAGNTLFVLCIGQYWGFHEFHRFIIPAFPPLLWVLRRYLPAVERVGAWAALGGASAVMALFALRLM